MSELPRLALLSAFIVAAALLGGAIPWWGRLRRDRVPPLVSASAGVLLGTALVHLLPEAYEAGGFGAVALAPVGLLSLYLLEKLLRGYGHGHGHVHGEEEEHTHGHDDGARPPASALAAFVGLALHSFFDGLALGAPSEEGLRGLIFVALLAHKAPTAFSLSAILRMSGVPPRRGLLYLLAFALFVPLGAFVFTLLPEGLRGEEVVGYALAFSAGNFLHVALDDLLPEVGREAKDSRAAVVGFVAGFVVAVGALLVLPGH